VIPAIFIQDLRAATIDIFLSGATLLYPEYWLPMLEQLRSLLKKIDNCLPGVVGEDLSTANLSLLSLTQYNNNKLSDFTLQNYLDELPSSPRPYESAMVIRTFCKANALGACSPQDIETWQAKQATEAPGKLETTGIEVKVTRSLIVPWAPIVLLISQQVFITLFRRREGWRRTGGGNLKVA
jgi:hypothetical protein